MKPMSVPDTPYCRINLDVLGPLPISNDYRYILVIVDSLTKHVSAVAMKDQSADTLTDCYTRNVVAIHGSPKQVVTDMGKNFMSNKFKSLLNVSNTQHITSPAYHHSSNGQAERTIRTIEERLRSLVNEKPDQWSKYLPFVIFSINTTKNCTTNMSPFFALYGRNAVVPEDVLFETTGRKPEEDRTEIWKDVKQAIETSNTKSIAKFRRNRRVRNRQVKEGDLVLVNRAPPAHKLAPQRPISSHF